MIEQLIEYGITDVCIKFVSIFNEYRLNSQRDDQNLEKLDIMSLNINSIELVQNLSKIMLNISTVARKAKTKE